MPPSGKSSGRSSGGPEGDAEGGVCKKRLILLPNRALFVRAGGAFAS